MSSNESSANTEKRDATERRAYERHPIYLSARIIIDGAGARSCVIRDYCLGGMLLVFDQESTTEADSLPAEVRLCTNDRIVIQCDFELNGAPNRLRFKARIAHTDDMTAGVAFVDPNLNALQLLRQFAREFPAAEYNRSASGDPHAETHAGIETHLATQIINSCDSVIIESASPLITDFFESVSSDLFEFAKAQQDPGIQNAYFQALGVFSNNAERLKNQFIGEISDQMRNKQLDETEQDEGMPSDLRADSLHLVEDEEFDKWLAVSNIANRVETDHAQTLSHLEKRLSTLFDKPISRKNNPYGPCVFVSAFSKMLDNLELDHAVSIKCYEVFRKGVQALSNDLYINLNTYLIDQNILPVITHEIARQKPTSQDKSQTVPENEDVVDSQPENKQPDNSESTAAESAENQPDNETHATEQIHQQALPKPQDLFALVGELRELQQQLKANQLPATPQNAPASQQSATLPQAGTDPAAHSAPFVSYSKPELLDALSGINLSWRHDNGNSGGPGLLEQLQTALSSKHDDATDKVIAKEEAYVIDVAENVLDALLSDLQVASSVRPWLEKLGVPLMKMALLDKSLFVDKSHIVRQVVNKLAELEILAEAEDDMDQKAIRQAFNWVIDLVNNQFDGTTQVFVRAMQQLDLLGKVQQQSYEKNLKFVIAEFMQEERQQVHDDKVIATVSAEELKQDEWLRRVQRLKEGHWLLFDANTEEPKRLKLAWVAERNGKYIFVNVIGRKDRICHEKELAEMLRTSDAVVLDGVDEPVMDRAQYTMLQNLHKQLVYQASHDELTGLINRREFEKSLQVALKDVMSKETKHAVFQFDIDKFKVINNTYGYEAGDALIRQIVELVEKNIEPAHILARVGTDEFGIILQEQALDDALEILEDFMFALEEYRFEWGDDRLSVSVSAGLAMINAQSTDISSVMQAVDSSCSLAKEMGGNRIQVYHSSHARLSRRKSEMRWATKIDKALDEDSLFLRCQKISPIQPHLYGEVHYEVLLGLPEELGGQSSLQEFIQAAEHYNRMQEVDRWVIKKTFNWLAEHESEVSDIAHFSINLSGHSLNDENLIEFVYQQAKETATPIEKVCFEITETAGISNLSDAADFITTIKGTGCKFSLDDFGSGMSSYSYLKSLPVDYLKIDGVFIRDIDQNPSDFAVVKSICEIAHFMDKSVIAEFVKDDATVAILKELGVDFAQGYGIDKPHLLDDLIR